MMRLPEQIIADVKKVREDRESLNAKEAQLLQELAAVRDSINEFLK